MSIVRRPPTRLHSSSHELRELDKATPDLRGWYSMHQVKHYDSAYQHDHRALWAPCHLEQVHRSIRAFDSRLAINLAAARRFWFSLTNCTLIAGSFGCLLCEAVGLEDSISKWDFSSRCWSPLRLVIVDVCCPMVLSKIEALAAIRGDPVYPGGTASSWRIQETDVGIHSFQAPGCLRSWMLAPSVRGTPPDRQSRLARMACIPRSASRRATGRLRIRGCSCISDPRICTLDTSSSREGKTPTQCACSPSIWGRRRAGDTQGQIGRRLRNLAAQPTSPSTFSLQPKATRINTHCEVQFSGSILRTDFIRIDVLWNERGAPALTLVSPLGPNGAHASSRSKDHWQFRMRKLPVFKAIHWCSSNKRLWNPWATRFFSLVLLHGKCEGHVGEEGVAVHPPNPLQFGIVHHELAQQRKLGPNRSHLLVEDGHVVEYLKAMEAGVVDPVLQKLKVVEVALGVATRTRLRARNEQCLRLSITRYVPARVEVVSLRRCPSQLEIFGPRV